ncbi:hypothetical protein D3C77_523470 [compost metagenome]
MPCSTRQRRTIASSRPRWLELSSTHTWRPRAIKNSASSSPTSPPPTMVTRLPNGIHTRDNFWMASVLSVTPIKLPAFIMVRWVSDSLRLAISSARSPVIRRRSSSPLQTWFCSAPGMFGAARCAPVATITWSTSRSRNKAASTLVCRRTSMGSCSTW